MDERLDYYKINIVATIIGLSAAFLNLVLTTTFLEETPLVIFIASIVVVVAYIIKLICWFKTDEKIIINLICYIVVLLSFAYLGFMMIGYLKPFA